jgi:hypothetical protein
MLFIGFSILVSAIASWLAHSPHHQPIAVAATMDLALTVPAAWYWLMVRPGLRSKATVAFVACLGFWRASLLFPEVLPNKPWIGMALELMLVAAVVAGWRAVRSQSAAYRDADPLDRLSAAIQSQIARAEAPGFPAKAIATEFSVFYYAFAWRARPHVLFGSQAFSLHNRSGSNVLVACLAGVSVLELVPVHLLLHHWSATAAWVASGISVWGMVWMVALSRSFALRPTLVSPAAVTVRFGLLFRLTIPAEKILSIEAGSAAPQTARVVPRGAAPSVYIRFTEPLRADFIAGIGRQMSEVALSADNDHMFREALNTLF